MKAKLWDRIQRGMDEGFDTAYSRHRRARI